MGEGISVGEVKGTFAFGCAHEEIVMQDGDLDLDKRRGEGVASLRGPPVAGTAALAEPPVAGGGYMTSPRWFNATGSALTTHQLSEALEDMTANAGASELMQIKKRKLEPKFATEKTI